MNSCFENKGLEMGNKGFEINMRGLDELRKKAENLSGTNHVKLLDLFNVGFMRKNTSFSSAEEMFEKSGLEIENEEDIKKNQEVWDDFVKTNTNYAGWEAMLKAATLEWVKKGLGF